MKKILSILTVTLLAAITALGQSPSPGIFNYQGVARNSVGNVLVNKTITLRLTIHDGAAAGPTVYQESRTAVTNPFGLFNVQVGSAGASNVTGTIAGVNWGVNSKFIQVEIDPNGGTTFINIGTAQIASVPYALYASLANDLVLPFIKTQAAIGSTLIGLTNSATTGVQGAFTGTSASTDGNAYAITGTISSSSPGGFSSGVRGINNGTGGLGIGVYGSQAGSGWGVYGTTPSGIGVNGASTSGFGVFGSSTSGTGVNGSSTSGVGVFGQSNTSNAGSFSNTNAANTAPTLAANTNGAGDALQAINSGTGKAGTFTITNAANANFAVDANSNGTNTTVNSNNTGTGFAGNFTVNNAASTADALRASTNGTGASWAIRGISSGTNGAGLFQQTNAANTANNLQSNQAGLGRAGLFNSTNAASTANAVDINVAGTGFALRAASSNAAPKALRTEGGVQLTGINEALNRVLVSDAAGNATWQNAAVAGIVTGTGTTQFIPRWTSPSNIGNSLLFDDGTSIGLGTITPTHRFTVSHGGSTGIGVTSTAGFSVVDINAASGDAAIRFANAGVNQWNLRNRPGDNYLEIFELGGGGSRVVIQDATGNVGIGETANPTYKLDVLHGGSTGIRSRSSGSFSVVDIDAASGDAALRFQAAGVGQWNTRNRPADDYYEIFELGGGGSRLVIQDATGNVGIGETTNPTYKLDVLHGGSTGIRSRSSGSFSVVDIDAASGDAALRFANAGVNQWNIRNRPADDYLEIFELGGGGSRVVIQDGTGNVGIGETVNPTYKLDVLHGGATGIRSRSSGTFSVIDIDAANGDAALRFAKAGVNQWNTRNRPADDYYEIFELGGGGSRLVIQDGTGNVGIGETVNPTYKLDVLHGGATGIRSRSSGTFSVIDIDAANGDAALRFAKAGVNQWNTRNRPADDYYEIFELGGGGSRFVIQDGTGNVGVGATVSPTHKLHVQHGGATGIRSESTASYSVIDIDGFNGDAALRFFQQGTSGAAFRWVTRNAPGTNNYEIFGNNGASLFTDINYTTGKMTVYNDFTALGVKAFTMDYPLDPTNKTLMHAAVESNEVLNSYSGNIVTDASGKATVSLPEYFEAINKDYRYQLTVIGSFAQAIINKEVSNNKFEIATSIPNVKVSWEVKGVRNDARMKMNPFTAVQDKPAAQRGKYLDPKSHNQPESKGVSYDANMENSSLSGLKPVANKVAPASTGGSLDQPAIVAPVVTNKADNSGSLGQPAIVAPVTKSVDTNGSVAPVEKKADTKQTPATKGGSLDEMPKPVETKKVSTDPGSTKTE
ncbi:MAG: hypothetical protein IPP02_01990 [Chitinophagaceae bacterium]|nr:hypothetical protein [Chitinophagaceae bacterium]